MQCCWWRARHATYVCLHAELKFCFMADFSTCRYRQTRRLRRLQQPKQQLQLLQRQKREERKVQRRVHKKSHEQESGSNP